MTTFTRSLLLFLPIVSIFSLIAVLTISDATTSEKLRRIIVDVDPGIDDIEALVILLDADLREVLKLEAIVVTEGNTHHEYGVRNVYLLLEAANRTDIPVYLGATRAILKHDTPMGDYFGKDGIGDLVWKTTARVELLQEERAFDFIHELTSRHPKEVTYMGLAPITTLAMAILLHPEIPAQLKDVYSMAGLYYKDEGEFNVKFDAEAYDIVLRSLESKMVLVTWQAGQTNSPATDWYKDESDVAWSPLWRFMVRIQDAINRMIFGDDLSNAKWEHCDPIVPAVYLKPELIKKQFTSPLMVEVGKGPARGVITNSSNKDDALVNVVLEINYDEFLKDFVMSYRSFCKDHPCYQIN